MNKWTNHVVENKLGRAAVLLRPTKTQNSVLVSTLTIKAPNIISYVFISHFLLHRGGQCTAYTDWGLWIISGIKCISWFFHIFSGMSVFWNPLMRMIRTFLSFTTLTWIPACIPPLSTRTSDYYCSVCCFDWKRLSFGRLNLASSFVFLKITNPSSKCLFPKDELKNDSLSQTYFALCSVPRWIL